MSPLSRCGAGTVARLKGTVEAKGHPLHIEITVDYQTTTYQIQIQQITARSDHPICYSRDE